jgi:uncharacterized membrane protein
VIKFLKWLLKKLTQIANYFKINFYHNRWRKNIHLLGLFLGVLILIIGNWKLLLATISGVGIMFIIYQWNELNWQKYWLKWRELSISSHGKFILAVSSGGIVAIITYIMATMWDDTENHWLATGAILQGLISAATLGFLSWQSYKQKLSSHISEFEQILIDLTATSSLKRLIAVRKLTERVKSNSLNLSQKEQVKEYFELMLKLEKEPIISHVLQESLFSFYSPQSLQKIDFSRKKKLLEIPVKSELLINNISRRDAETQRDF